MLRNSTKAIAIVEDVRIAESFFGRLRGLMFEHRSDFNYALVMPLSQDSRIRASIHMLFVFFPIAVFFVDEKKRVVDKALLKPFALNYTPKKPCRYIIELPQEKFSCAEVGDLLEW